MKAVRLSEISPIDSNPLDLVEVEAPSPQADQIRIRVEACGS